MNVRHPPSNSCSIIGRVDGDKHLNLRPAAAVHTRLFDGELVILDLEKGDYYALDEIGTALWHGLAAGKTVEQIGDEITELYEVKREQVIADLVSLCDTLVARGLVVHESH
jgi:hypothetical protein